MPNEKIGNFNESIESLVAESRQNGLSDPMIVNLLLQQVTVMASENMRNDESNFDTWKAVQQASQSQQTLAQSLRD